MNLNAGLVMTRSNVTAAPLTEMAEKAVEALENKQHVAEVKFFDKKPINLPNSDWIAGVDHENEALANDENDGNCSTTTTNPQRVPCMRRQKRNAEFAV